MCRSTLSPGAVAAFVSVLLAATAGAQWSPDNLRISGPMEYALYTQVRSTSDGGCYVGWLHTDPGSWLLYLDRLDPQGYKLWGDGHCYVSSPPEAFPYGLAVDAADHAIIAHYAPSLWWQIRAKKIAPSAALLWDVGLSELGYINDPPPKVGVAVTSHGNYCVAWTYDNIVGVQMLEGADGSLLWDPTLQITEAILSDLVASDDGAVIALWVHPSGNNRHLYAQKYSAAGGSLWGSAPAVIYDGGSVGSNYFPTFVSDGAGGAVFGWSEATGARNSYVQHIDAGGVELFPHNGVAASTLAGRVRSSPSVTYNSATGDIFLFWVEENANQTGLYGQRFSPAGARLWTEHGKELLPPSYQHKSNVRAVTYADGAMVFFLDDYLSPWILAMRVDSAGMSTWPGSPIVVGGGEFLDVDRTPSGMALLAWLCCSPLQYAYAQNVNPDGTLGLPAFILGDLNCDGVVDFDDINPFVLALSDPAGYGAAFPSCNILNGDCNNDGNVDFEDINPFVALLSGNRAS